MNAFWYLVQKKTGASGNRSPTSNNYILNSLILSDASLLNVEIRFFVVVILAKTNKKLNIHQFHPWVEGHCLISIYLNKERGKRQFGNAIQNKHKNAYVFVFHFMVCYLEVFRSHTKDAYWFFFFLFFGETHPMTFHRNPLLSRISSRKKINNSHTEYSLATLPNMYVLSSSLFKRLKEQKSIRPSRKTCFTPTHSQLSCRVHSSGIENFSRLLISFSAVVRVILTHMRIQCSFCRQSEKNVFVYNACGTAAYCSLSSWS